jgi:uncharacterized OB-fold protein
MSEEQKKPRLTLNRESRPYFEAAGKGRLVIKKCNACARVHYYPRTICPHCHSDDTEFVEASGRGVIYSYSVTRQATPPYVIAYVTLEEGVTMLTNIVDCDVDSVRVGQKVKVKFIDAGDGFALPMFWLA